MQPSLLLVNFSKGERCSFGDFGCFFDAVASLSTSELLRNGTGAPSPVPLDGTLVPPGSSRAPH